MPFQHRWWLVRDLLPGLVGPPRCARGPLPSGVAYPACVIVCAWRAAPVEKGVRLPVATGATLECVCDKKVVYGQYLRLTQTPSHTPQLPARTSCRTRQHAHKGPLYIRSPLSAQ